MRVDELLDMGARVKAAIELMNKSVGAQSSMRGLAAKVNLAPARLRQLFKKETGGSPLQYLRDLLRHAQELLHGTFLSIK
jgi:transcriptional regulator GlxA family with amidase domain